MGRSIKDINNSVSRRVLDDGSLHLSDENLDNLKGIEDLRDLNISILYLSKNNLTNLDGIECLESLDELYVTKNNLTSLKGIEKLENLKRLYVSNNKIESLQYIPFINMKYLNLSNNPIKTLDGIEKFKVLKELDVNETDIESLLQLKGLKFLTRFHADLSNLKSLEGIEDLYKLRDFSIDFNPCSKDYVHLDVYDIRKKIKVDLHLKPGDDERGAASIMDTGLFDFKIK